MRYSIRAGPLPGCVLGFTVTACLPPFVSHKGHMEMFSWLKADQCALSRARNICYLYSRSVPIKFSEQYRQLQYIILINNFEMEACLNVGDRGQTARILGNVHL